jgi:hypothetical protein
VVALAALAFFATRRRRSAKLQQRFGPEYDRVVAERGDRQEAESELADRFTRRQGFEVRRLSPAARDRYAERWQHAQRDFVDQPAAAIGKADLLVLEVMEARGYPGADEFEQRAADVSVDHPDVVEHYRAAHDISQRATDNRASTEDLRQAMIHFRALFDELLDREDRHAAGAGGRERDGA